MKRLLQPNDDDEANRLFSLAASRDQGALLELAALYRDALRNLAKRELAGEERMVEDVSSAVQESMVRIAKNATWFECRSLLDFEKWLTTILRNVVRDKEKYWLAERRHPDRVQTLHDLDSREFWQHAHSTDIPAADADLAGQDEQDFRWQMTRKALQKLPAHYQAIIRSYFDDGESIGEVADRLGASKDATRMLLKRAVEALKVRVEELVDPDSKASSTDS